MPKRAATAPEESPRKVTRKSKSQSPAKGSKLVKLAVDAKEDVSGGLMNISDEEIEVAPAAAPAVEIVPETTTKQAVTATLSFNFNSVNEMRILREKFFEKFSADIAGEVAEVDVESYRKLLEEVPEEDQAEKRFLVDQYMRDFVLEKVLSNREYWSQFLQLSIDLSKGEICSPSIPISLLSDLIDLSSLQDCEAIFEYVEQRLSVWKEPIFLNAGKNAVLRMCNDLLRRLSRAQNTIFCGRILIFLANYFPFSERSGLNIMSEFNAENVTSYKSSDGSDDPEDKMETDKEETNEKLFDGIDISIPGLDRIVSITQEEKKKKVKVDYNLYVKFWSLQDFFRNPIQCYNKIAWKTFTLYTHDVLNAFTSFKIEGAGTSLKPEIAQIHHHHSSVNFIPRLGDEDLYFPKYLTNRRLLELQMGDPNFRRYFMIQLLIILQYLTTTVKFKSENQVLSEDQVDFVKKTSERIYHLLKEIRPGGKEFVKAVHHVLKREDLWSKWKNDGCQPFKKPTPAGVSVDAGKSVDPSSSGASDISGSSAVPAKPQKKRSLGDILEEADKNNKYEFGNPELTRLWNICGDNLEACRSENRDFLPSIENFFTDAFKELDPEPTPPAVVADPSKREVKPKKLLSNANFGWRALRLLARNSPFFFQLVASPPIQPLHYLEYILKKIAAEMETPKEEGQEKDENAPKDSQANGVANTETAGNNEGDQVVDGSTDENDELLTKAELNKQEEPMEEEEGEVNEYVRNLTDTERVACGKLLKAHWQQLAAKFQFGKDEIELFETERGEDAAAFMLQVWTENETDDATVADLLYRLEGLKLRHLVKDVFPLAN